eukprot:Hpha_TRINITY_DN16308_c2_g5::TRINITY_DN16308_c2_g5_i2::g.58746::m.58746
MGCCRWGWLVRQGDTTEEAHIKTTVFPFALCILIIWMVILVRQLQSNNQMIYVVGNAINAFAMILFMGGAIINAIPAGYLLDVLLVLCTLGISAMDLGEATTSYPFRGWTGVVLLLDCALVFKRYHMPGFIIPFVLACQAALQVESVSRFGLFELGYWGTA